MLDILLLIIGSVGLIIGTITDFQKREVADYINYFLVFAGLGLRCIGSINSGDWLYFLIPLGWFAVAYGFGLLMYYTGQWGGGDAKMIMGLAALFGTTQFPGFTNDVLQSIIPYTFSYQIFFFPHFLFNAFFFGAIYSIIWTIALAFIHHNAFKKTFKKKFKKIQAWFVFSIIFFVIAQFFIWQSGDLILLLETLAVTVVMLPVLFVFIKTIEKACMITYMNIEDLTEGEWIVDTVRIKGKYVCGPKDLGISNDSIKKLKKYEKEGLIDKVKVKIGIPFVPAFLIAFIFTYFYGNVIFLIL